MLKELNKVYKKLIIYISALIILVLFVFLFNTIIDPSDKLTTYTVTPHSSYNVKYKNNLEANSDVFVSNNVDNITFNLNYDYDFSNNVSYIYTYKVEAHVISTLDDSKSPDVLNTKKIVLDRGQSVSGTGKFNINKQYDIDYSEYNKYANDYNLSVNVPIKSKLKILLIVTMSFENGETEDIETEMSLPLETTTFSITNSDVSISNTISKKDSSNGIGIANILFGIAILLFIGLIVVEVFNYSKIKKRNYMEFKYRKIMKDYGNLVVPINTLPKDENMTAVCVSYFKSILDIQRELHLPILCYNCKKYIAYFIINNNYAYVYYLNNSEEKI